MNLIDALNKNNLIENTKGGLYYESTMDANLDLFSHSLRFLSDDKLNKLFFDAYNEDRNLALSNLLHILDIRGGKGERKAFKSIFKKLCLKYPSDALIILNNIKELGRYDYILEGIYTPIEDSVIELIKNTPQSDINSDNPSLLAKWMPSLRRHGVTDPLAKHLAIKLGLEEKEYRHILSDIRKKLNIVERNITNKKYENICYENVPFIETYKTL